MTSALWFMAGASASLLFVIVWNAWVSYRARRRARYIPRDQRKGRNIDILIVALCIGSLALSAVFTALTIAREIEWNEALAPMPESPRLDPAIPVRASWYGEQYRGLPMALNGQPFNPDEFTCAHRTLGAPGEPSVYVQFIGEGGRTLTIPVTDRGPWDKDPRTGEYRKDFDLSRAAFQYLDPNLDKGVLRIQARRVP